MLLHALALTHTYINHPSTQYDTHEQLVALIARFVHHLYGQDTGERPAYIPHESLRLVSECLYASAGVHPNSQAPVAFGAMFILQRLGSMCPGACLPGFASADDYFVAAFAVAQKYLLDVNTTNGRLVDAVESIYTTSVRHLNVLERTLLQAIGYDVSMDLEQLVVFVQSALTEYSNVPVYVLKEGMLLSVKEGCWPYFGEQLLVPRVLETPYYTPGYCTCTSCLPSWDWFLPLPALVFPSPTLSLSNM